MNQRLHIHSDRARLSQRTANRVAEIACEAIAQRGAFRIALAGGNTPRGLYRCLAAPSHTSRIDWTRVHIYFGDERCVPLDHPDSNYRMAREAMLDRVPIPSSQVHPLCQTPQEPEDDAARYARLLDEQLPATADGMPVFDLILLGLGSDGHTASLFPGTPILDERSRSVAAVHVPKLDSWRVSLTLPVLDHARRLLFLVAGGDKAAMVEQVLGPANGEPVPVQRIQARGEVEWHLDADAAALLDAEATS